MTRSADFERALARPACARSAHFAIHFLPADARRPVAAEAPAPKLSTDIEHLFAHPVDEFACLGAVVPKRHARRAVTRTLLKRQIRAAAARSVATGGPAGMWIVRLRAPFDRTRFVAAASDALRRAARAELDAAFDSASSSVLQARRAP